MKGKRRIHPSSHLCGCLRWLNPSLTHHPFPPRSCTPPHSFGTVRSGQVIDHLKAPVSRKQEGQKENCNEWFQTIWSSTAGHKNVCKPTFRSREPTRICTLRTMQVLATEAPALGLNRSYPICCCSIRLFSNFDLPKTDQDSRYVSVWTIQP